MGRPRSSLLAPVLRSEAQARVLASILLAPESLHVQAIADRTRLPYSVVQREVDRLEKGRLVSSSRFATARLVRPNEDHPLFPELRALLLKAYGPHAVLGAFLEEPGVEAGYVYGSWAARYVGEAGSPPADADVLLVGEVPPARVAELEAEAEDILGQPVHVEVVPRREWEKPVSAFVRTVKRRPLVEIERRSR